MQITFIFTLFIYHSQTNPIPFCMRFEVQKCTRHVCSHQNERPLSIHRQIIQWFKFEQKAIFEVGVASSDTILRQRKLSATLMWFGETRWNLSRLVKYTAKFVVFGRKFVKIGEEFGEIGQIPSRIRENLSKNKHNPLKTKQKPSKKIENPSKTTQNSSYFPQKPG